MPAGVRFHPAAAEEVLAAFEWYAERSEAAADGSRKELQHAVVAISNGTDQVASVCRLHPALRFSSLSLQLDLPAAW